MEYTLVSFDSWPRRDTFRHFIDNLRCVITITSEVDVTEALAFCREKELRFYPTFLYLVAKALNRRDEWKMGYDGAGKLIRWREISPSHILFHPEDELVSRLVTAYSPDFAQFYRAVEEGIDRYREKRGFEVEWDAANTFDASCVPWLRYSACDLHVYDEGRYLAPVVTWGKYGEKDGRLTLPLTMQIHHAVADGFHVARFYQDLQSEIQILTS